jgi:Fur family transcriptional regulator, ferric uptake regulator
MKHADELKNSGLKATLPRIKVLEIFQKTVQRHMSAEDVYRMAPMSAWPPSTAC